VSTHDKPLSPGAARYIVDSVADDEAKRIEGLTGDELRAEIADDGGAPWKPSSTEELLARVKARAAAGRGVVPPAMATDAHRERRDPETEPKLPARALLAGIVTEAPAIVAHLRGTPTPIASDAPPEPRRPEMQLAERLRDEAIGRCAAGQWAECGAKLDEAKRIDPGGEAQPRVVKARGQIEEGAKEPPVRTDSTSDLKR
jgi:hypothetical protein